MGGEQAEGKKRCRSRKRSKNSAVNADQQQPAAGGDSKELHLANTNADEASDDDGDRSTNDNRQHEIDGKDETGNDYAEKDEGEDPTDRDASKKRKRKRNRKKKSDITNADKNGPNTQNNSEEDAAKLNSVEHTVFIEGLPFTSTEEEIRLFFSYLGCNDILQLRLPRWQDSNRLRGFGHVVFASKETRARALSDDVNGKELGGRYITVREANAPRSGTSIGAALGRSVREQPKGCKTVFVRNLPYDATEQQVLENFRVCGKILDDGVRIARNRLGQSKGFGYVDYKNEEGAFLAVQKAAKPFGIQVQGRPVFVDYDDQGGKMKNSFRDSEGKLWTKEHHGSRNTMRGGVRGSGGIIERG